MYIKLSLFSYILDRIFGEYPKITHIIIIIGKLISFFEKYFYKDSVLRGAILVIFILSIVYSFALIISKTNFFVELFFSTWLLASKSLYDSVKEILIDKSKIKYLVSRDTANLSDSDIYKAAIETYAENLNDGVIAPLFYLSLFGIEGIFVYKAVNTLDSMVGYRIKKYEKFGKISARLDDILNYIPSRITAILILVLNFNFNFKYLYQAKYHKSPNAGYPITAMGIVLRVKLGGDASYFGKIEKKPYFGIGKTNITKLDLINALKFQKKLDISIVVLLIFGLTL